MKLVVYGGDHPPFQFFQGKWAAMMWLVQNVVCRIKAKWVGNDDDNRAIGVFVETSSVEVFTVIGECDTHEKAARAAAGRLREIAARSNPRPLRVRRLRNFTTDWTKAYAWTSIMGQAKHMPIVNRGGLCIRREVCGVYEYVPLKPDIVWRGFAYIELTDKYANPLWLVVPVRDLLPEIVREPVHS